MIQKAKKIFSPFSRKSSHQLAEQRRDKLAKTQEYLQNRRSFGVPTTPMGFKTRSSSSYFLSNYR
ncbi:MAG: hypothetical protein U0516_03525 [Candidatus Saccharibacteria bacterium]